MLTRILTLAVTATAAMGMLGCNSAPIVNDNSATTSFAKPVDVDVVANCTDPDGDKLKVIDVGKPTNGMSAIKNDHMVTYTPNPGFAGRDQLAFTVCDQDRSHARSAILYVTVAPEPQTTVIIPPPSHDTVIVTAPEPSQPSGVVNAGVGRAPDMKTETRTLTAGYPALVVRGPYYVKVLTWSSQDPMRFEVGPADSQPKSLSGEPIELRSGQVDLLVPDGKALFVDGNGNLTLSGYAP